MNKNIYAKRKETIERVFADAKEKHGMRWTFRTEKKFDEAKPLKSRNWTWKALFACFSSEFDIEHWQ